MPVSLEQAQQNAQTAYDVTVIDEFRTNPLMDMLVFDDVVNPSGGGATLTHGYRRVVTTSGAGFRALNSEYAPTEATTEQKSVNLKVLGGAYQIDRIIAKIGPAASAEVAFQTEQKIKSVKAAFGDAVINGDEAVDVDSFDGLKKALAGSSTEDTNLHDLSTPITTSAQAFEFLALMDDLASAMDGEPGVYMSNRLLVNKLKTALRFANSYVEKAGPRAGVNYATYGNAVLLDAGFKDGSAEPVIPVVGGETALYAVRFGLDGFHGVTTVGSNIISTYLPDFTTAGAVKTGEVEMGPVAVALKATKAAAVATRVKVA